MTGAGRQAPATNNLPAELTSFVGREPQLAELRRLMRRSRLITLTGPGGAGKTRLALRLATESLDRVPDGVWLIELATIGDGRLLENTVAGICGITEEPKRRPLDVLADGLATKRSLLILDGCEHLVDACAELAGVLLRSCATLSILATSREPLGLSGEVIWRTPSLTVPRLEDEAHAELLMESEAIRLFVDRARLSRPDFVLGAADATSVAHICARLEGMPLAIELASGLVGVMTLEEILDRLHHRFRLLTGGGRGSLPRHQTLRQAVDWSYGLLTSNEQSLFTRLAVFAGGFDLAAAEAVVSGEGIATDDVLSLLSRLVNKSLVVAEPRRAHTTRYRMLDTIREYALEKLQIEGETAWRRKHAAYFTGWSAMATEHLGHGEQVVWHQRLDEEQPNIRLALEWSLVEEPDDALRIAADSGALWRVNRSLSEGYVWLTRALDASGTDQKARAAALIGRARQSRRMGDYTSARQDAEAAARIAREAGLLDSLSAALTMLGIACDQEGRGEASLRYFHEAMELAIQTGDKHRTAGSLNNIAMAELGMGRNEEALAHGKEAVAIIDAIGDRILKALVLDTVARTNMHLGRHDEALRDYSEALALSEDFHDAMTIADCLEGIALLALSRGDPTRCLTLVSAGASLRSTTGSERTHEWSAEVLAAAARARTRLASAAAEAAKRKGGELGEKEAIALALGLSAARARNGGTPLTGREIEVARLIEEGLSNVDLAKRLRISQRTVDAHVEHIRNKLGLRSRAQIALWTKERLGGE